METVFYIIASAVRILLDVISVAMLLRVILQFFVDPENKFYALCYYISEIVIYPFRLLFAHFKIAENSPLDIPFFIGWIFLSALNIFLPVI